MYVYTHTYIHMYVCDYTCTYVCTSYTSPSVVYLIWTLSVLWLTLSVDGGVHTLKFYKPRMAEYPYRMPTVTEWSPSNFERPLQLTKQIRRLQWQTAHLPATPTRCIMHHCSQPSRKWKYRTVFLFIFFGDWLWVIDGGAHFKFWRLQTSGFFYAVRESFLGDDK